ncbi:MAG: hypothetical protein GYA14_08615, partial [Ignavibacteria bacterium]|nr:hypothetical protein [Ignavibacteria bacterium]
DLSLVDEMGPETLTCYCALINDLDFTKGMALSGNTPTKKTLREMFNKAGFYDFVASDHPPKRIKEDIYGKLIHKITRSRVEGKLAADVCQAAYKHTFNDQNYNNKNIYTILIECMANTRNHANYGSRNTEYNWWLLAYAEPNTRITKFCFLDLGVGIFESLNKKYTDQSLVERFKRVIVPNDNKKTLQRIFKGDKESSTNSPGRGLGIINIYGLVRNNSNISNFTLLSNNVIAKISYNMADSIDLIKSNFDGTLYYWELIPN